jgi:hypothetical protein
MKRIYDWITKANQVLLFLVIIGGTAFISYMVYQSTRRYDPPHVSIAQTSEEAKNAETKEVSFLDQWSGLYVFAVMKRVITPSEGPFSKRAAYLGNGDDSGQTVNIIFSKGDQKVRTLLQNDGLVLWHNLSSEPKPEKIKALLFNCVTEDTDGNHRLDASDRNDLYVLSEGLEKPDLVIKGVRAQRTISPTHLIVETGDPNDPRVSDVDIVTQAQKEIVWK